MVDSLATPFGALLQAIWVGLCNAANALWFVAVSIDQYRLKRMFKHDIADPNIKLVENPLVREQELLHTSAVFLFSAGLVANFLSAAPFTDSGTQSSHTIEEKWQFQTLWGVTMLLTLSALLSSFAARTGIFQLWSMTRDYIKHLTNSLGIVWSLETSKQPALLVAAKLAVYAKKADLETKHDLQRTRSTQHLSANTGSQGLQQPAASNCNASTTNLPASYMRKLHGLPEKYQLLMHRQYRAEKWDEQQFKSEVLKAMYWLSMGPSVRCATSILGIFLFFSRFCFGISLCLWLATIQYTVVALKGAWAAADQPGKGGGLVIFIIVCVIEFVAMAAAFSLMIRGWQIFKKYHSTSAAHATLDAVWLQRVVDMSGVLNKPINDTQRNCSLMACQSAVSNAGGLGNPGISAATGSVAVDINEPVGLCPTRQAATSRLAESLELHNGRAAATTLCHSFQLEAHRLHIESPPAGEIN